MIDKPLTADLSACASLITVGSHGGTGSGLRIESEPQSHEPSQNSGQFSLFPALIRTC